MERKLGTTKQMRTLQSAELYVCSRGTRSEYLPLTCIKKNDSLRGQNWESNFYSRRDIDPVSSGNKINKMTMKVNK
jgi:hypothetical protein